MLLSVRPPSQALRGGPRYVMARLLSRTLLRRISAPLARCGRFRLLDAQRAPLRVRRALGAFWRGVAARSGGRRCSLLSRHPLQTRIGPIGPIFLTYKTPPQKIFCMYVVPFVRPSKNTCEKIPGGLSLVF